MEVKLYMSEPEELEAFSEFMLKAAAARRARIAAGVHMAVERRDMLRAQGVIPERAVHSPLNSLHHAVVDVAEATGAAEHEALVDQVESAMTEQGEKPTRKRRSKVEIAAEKHGVTVEAIHAAAGGECAPGDADEVAARIARKTVAAVALDETKTVEDVIEAAGGEVLPPEHPAPDETPIPANEDGSERVFTLDDVTAAITAISDKHSPNHAFALLGVWGAKSRKTLAEADRGPFVLRAEAIIAAGAWPADIKVEG